MSGASTMRNAVKRIAHKERAQPESRKRLGLLEKHKDYVERAQDYKKKKKVLTTLRKKADERNPDEFYYHMYNSKIKDGKHAEINSKDLTPEVLHLLQSQDLGYLVHRKAIDDEKIRKLKEQIHLIGDALPRSHKIFVDEADDLEKFDPAEHFDTRPELLDRAYNIPRKHQIEEEKVALASKKRAAPLALSAGSMEDEMEFSDKKKKRRISPQLAELKARHARVGKIKEAMEVLTLKRIAASPGHKVKQVVTKAVGKNGKEKEMVLYKFKRERKK